MVRRRKTRGSQENREGAAASPACTRRVAGMVRGLREPSLQDRKVEGGEPGLGILASCPMVWLPAGFRQVEGGASPPAPGRRQEKLVLAPLSLCDSKWPIIEYLQEWEAHPLCSSDPKNHGLKSIPLESGTARCPVPTLWGCLAPQANTWSFEQVTLPPSVCPPLSQHLRFLSSLLG